MQRSQTGILVLVLLSPVMVRLAYLRVVLFHGLLVAGLVCCSTVVPHLAFLGVETLELRRDDARNVTKARFGVGRLDLRTGIDRVQEVRTHVALGHVRIFLGFFLLATVGWIVSRDVMLHLFGVTHLVLFRFFLPFARFLLGQFLVLAGQDAGLGC